MLETDTETENIKVRINTELLESMDETWQESG